MSTGNFAVCKYVEGHYPISKGHRGAREQKVENPTLAYTLV